MSERDRKKSRFTRLWRAVGCGGGLSMLAGAIAWLITMDADRAWLIGLATFLPSLALGFTRPGQAFGKFISDWGHYIN